MAIFEEPGHNKILLDDTSRIVCHLDSTLNVEKHTEYIINLRRRNEKGKWTINHRYKDFSALNNELQISNILLPLPPKKLIGNMQPSFVAERQIALQNYLEEIMKHPILELSLPVRRFLDPKNYSQNFTEKALQSVSIALRGEGRFELKGPAPDIGWRIRKHYFLVTDCDKDSECMLSYQNYGPDRYLCDKDLQSAFKSLQGIAHPNIDPIVQTHSLESGVYVVRRIHQNGTMKDMLYGADYNKNYLLKYANSKVRKPFTCGQIAHYGHQILTALQFLHDKGLPHGHIHPGNIAIENQKALLLDLENILVGAPSIYRPFIIQLKKPMISEYIDVYAFGRTLYEMAFAQTLDTVYCDSFPSELPVGLESLLRLCLSSQCVKHEMPSLKGLLQHPFFTQGVPITIVNGVDKPHLKFATSVKAELSKAVQVVESRMQLDQKLNRSAKREDRLKHILSSEEEIRKQKRRAKRREGVWKSSSSLTETTRSQSISTSSSPTPPHLPLDSSVNSPSSSKSTPAPPTSPLGNGRGALLSAICSFDKNKLSRVKSVDRGFSSVLTIVVIYCRQSKGHLVKGSVSSELSAV